MQMAINVGEASILICPELGGDKWEQKNIEKYNRLESAPFAK